MTKVSEYHLARVPGNGILFFEHALPEGSLLKIPGAWGKGGAENCAYRAPRRWYSWSGFPCRISQPRFYRRKNVESVR